jgi:hypothetical protein
MLSSANSAERWWGQGAPPTICTDHRLLRVLEVRFWGARL